LIRVSLKEDILGCRKTAARLCIGRKQIMKEILDVFEYCGMKYEVLTVGEGWQAVVTEHGGHVFGPFSKECPEGIFWIPETIKDRESYKRLIDQKIWNIGGDRMWIAPEIQFNIKDRSRFRETLEQPKTMDPGSYKMTREGESVHLEMELDLTSYNTVEGSMHAALHRMIHKAENPLRRLPDYEELMKGLSYCGIEELIDLNVSSDEAVFAENWNLLQIRPKGTLFIPMYEPMRGTDHYEPAGDHEIVAENGICLRITGDSRYKIAYRSAVLTGRFGYLADSDTDSSVLIVICYPNNPSAAYSEEPPLIPGDTGYSIHVYNDDGNSGGFAEMECNMPAIGNPTGMYHAADRLTKWIFTGKTEQLRRAAKLLLGWKSE